jgi:enediyne biosynthesis protein E4
VKRLCLAMLLACVACGGDRRAPASTSSDQPWFVDRAGQSGLDFVHFNGMSGQFDYAEIIGPGAAMFDYDNDGDLDVFLVQGRMLGAGTPVLPLSPQSAAQLRGRLYRNDLTVNQDGTRTVHFTDVTEASGIDARGYGMGVATGDFNNDGCIDLYLTNLGRNQLYRNNCDGTFTDVSQQSGAAGDPGWSVSAAFLDYDHDGWLDLFVSHYLNYSVETNIPCFGPSGAPDYCSPNVYRPQASRLYHNNRDGTFTDVTAAAGLAHDFGPALGVSTADFNGDGWIDIYVSNDGHENQLWINQRDGTFKNMGLLSGTALSAHGKPKAGMGVDAGDFDNDGDEDLFVANLTGEGNDLYVNDGTATFEDQSAASGLGPASLAYTGFGAGWFDMDNDGRLDMLIVNGAVRTIDALRQAKDPFPLHQRKLLFRNLGGGRFEDVTAKGGAAFELSEVGRGAAFGDIDNDGDIDVLVANNSGHVRLLMNMVGNRNHWVGLRLVGRSTRRDMLGARVAIIGDNGSTMWRRARADGSYASAKRSESAGGPRSVDEAAENPRRVAGREDRRVEQRAHRSLHHAGGRRCALARSSFCCAHWPEAATRRPHR